MSKVYMIDDGRPYLVDAIIYLTKPTVKRGPSIQLSSGINLDDPWPIVEEYSSEEEARSFIKRVYPNLCNQIRVIK